jgi:hypothetical protein
MGVFMCAVRGDKWGAKKEGPVVRRAVMEPEGACRASRWGLQGFDLAAAAQAWLVGLAAWAMVLVFGAKG